MLVWVARRSIPLNIVALRDLSLNAEFTRYRSWFLVVALGRPDRDLSTVEPVLLNLSRNL